MSRLFTLGEATKLLPRVASKIHDAVREKREYAEAETRFRAGVERITMMGGTFVNAEQSHGIRSRRDNSLGRLKETLEGIQELGVLVKDLDVGLIDFPTLYRGQEVYLCWKMGEKGIEWWHGVEEGFRGRKPIDADFIANHTGGEKEDD